MAVAVLVAAPPAGATPPPAPAPAPAPPAPAPPPPGPPPARAWLLVDVGTGRILAQQDEHLPLPPASLTKVLTALIAVAWLPHDAQLGVSARDGAVYPNRVGMAPGQTWTLDEALHTLLIYSANDAAYALAERISPTVEDFAELMGLAASQMGMTDHPVWHDPAGLDGTEGVGQGNLVSARDLAVAGRALLAQPYLASIVPLTSWRFTAPSGVVTEIPSENRHFLKAYPGSTGVKTGFTDPAGPCIIASATRGNRTMMAVVMNGANDVLTAQMLLDRGFATPAGAEPGGDVLPAVHLPAPPTPVKLVVQAGDGGIPTPVAVAPGSASGPGHGMSLLDLWPLTGGAALVAVGAATVLAARTRRRQRRSPAHARR